MRVRNLVMVVVLCCAAAPAMAQSLTVPPGRWWDRPQVAMRVGLSDEQRARLDEVTIEHAKRMIDLKAEVDKAEIELRVAADGDKFDADELRQAFARLLQARSRLETERFELLIAQRELLTAAQWEKLRVLARSFAERGRDREGGEGAPRAPRRPNGPRDF